MTVTQASDRAWDNAMRSRTLMQAHDALVQLRPTGEAPKTEWLRFHTRSAAVYTEVADVDRGHHHEALYWAGLSRRRADELLRKPSAEGDSEVRSEQS